MAIVEVRFLHLVSHLRPATPVIQSRHIERKLESRVVGKWVVWFAKSQKPENARKNGSRLISGPRIKTVCDLGPNTNKRSRFLTCVTLFTSKIQTAFSSNGPGHTFEYELLWINHLRWEANMREIYTTTAFCDSLIIRSDLNINRLF